MSLRSALRPNFTMRDVAALWHSLDKSKNWGRLAWAKRCVELPELVVIGESIADGGETFAMLDMFDGRVVPEEEVPSSHLDDGSSLRWVDVPSGPSELPA